MRSIRQYTPYDYRGHVYEGTFIETDDIKVGDWFLTHHTCMYTHVPVLQQVIALKVAYYFNDKPIYDLVVKGGSSYKSNLKHISIYDKKIKSVDIPQHLTKQQ